MTVNDRFVSVKAAIRAILTNRITIGFILLGAAYWLAAPFLPYEWRDLALLTFRAAITSGLALTGAAYFEAAVRSLAKGEAGSVTQWLAGIVIVCWSFSAGSAYSMLWVYLDRPPGMTNHPFLGFILLWQLVGVALLIKAPDADRPGITIYKARWFVAIAFVAAVILAFSVGRATNRSQSEVNSLHSSYGLPCPSKQPILGNVNSRGAKVYHSKASPYRAMVHPEQCFATEGEARAAGFRKAG